MSSIDRDSDSPSPADKEIKLICGAYEVALQQGQDLPIASFLALDESKKRKMLLSELWATRLKYRGDGDCDATINRLLHEMPECREDLSEILKNLQLSSNKDSDESEQRDESSEIQPDSGFEQTIDFDPSSAPTTDLQRLPNSCPNCSAQILASSQELVVGLSCPSCGISIGKTDSGQRHLTPVGGHERTVSSGGITSDLPGDVTGGEWVLGAGERFQKVGLHAVGGLGEVYRARDRQLDREVALKGLQAEHAKVEEKRVRFLLEGQVTGKLEHPGIVPVYSLGTDSQNRPFYIMRFVRGKSLAKAVKQLHRQESFDIHPSNSQLRNVLQSFIAACYAVEYAHSRGVLHCDIKPDNIMLGKHGETYLVDWGMARVEGQSLTAFEDLDDEPFALLRSRSKALSHKGSVLGTPAYMSPEQALGDAESIKEPSDVFSLGATLFQILTNQAPYVAGSVAEVLSMAAYAAYPSPREINSRIPKPLEAICLKALEAKPSDRFPHAGQLGQEVDRWLGDEPLESCPDSLFDRVRRFARRNRTLVAGGFLGVVTIAVVSTFATVAVNRARLQQQQLAQRNQELLISEAEAHTEAESRFVKARETVDVWLTGFSEALRRYPGMTSLRQEMLRKAAKEYEQFAADDLEKADLIEERARTLIRLGNLRRELGEINRAVTAYEMAAKVLGPAIRDEHNSLSSKIEWARAHERLGLAHADLGKYESAREGFLQGIATLSPLVEMTSHAEANVASELVSIHVNYASMLVQLEDFPEATLQYQLAAAILEKEEVIELVGSRGQEQSATIQLGQGYLALQLGDADMAKSHFLNAIMTLEEALGRNSNEFTIREQLATGRIALADALRAKGDLAGQLAESEATIQDYSVLATSFPEIVRYRENLAKMQTNYGQLLVEIGRLDDAVNTLETAAQTFRAMVFKYPLTLEYVHDYAVALDNLAYTNMMRGEYGKALANGDEAARILRELAETSPDLSGLQERLAVVESHNAQALMGLGSEEKALERFRIASELAKEIMRSPDREQTTAYLPNAAAIEANFGFALRQANQIDASRVSALQAKQYWEAWSERSSDGRAAAKAALFLTTCAEESCRDLTMALMLAMKARQSAPGNRQFVALSAAIHAELGHDKKSQQVLSTVLPSAATTNKIEDLPGCWLRLFEANVYARAGQQQKGKHALQQALEWSESFMPGNWDLQRMIALVASNLHTTMEDVPQDSESMQPRDQLKPAADRADSTD